MKIKIKENKTEIFIILFFAISCLVIYVFTMLHRNRFDEFYKHNLIGIVEIIEISSQLNTDLKLMHQSEKFHLHLKDYQNNTEGKELYDIAKVGDSLYKPAYSDTIYLYRRDSLIKVCFNKKK